MKTLMQYWKILATALTFFISGAWAQFAYINGLHATFSTVERFQSIIGSAIAIIVAFFAAKGAWNSVQAQINSAQRLNDINEQMSILAAYKCVNYELIHNQSIVQDIRIKFEESKKIGALGLKDPAINVLEKLINQAQTLSKDLFISCAHELGKGSHNIFAEVSVPYVLVGHVSISFIQIKSALEAAPESILKSLDNKIYNYHISELEDIQGQFNHANNVANSAITKLELEIKEMRTSSQ